ncbi:sensor histidine kinase [Bacillus sp. FJAT-45350]|uniref:sensor histidine kinase n=1 Tax=Bacillus sp. FJAT-45350 TaxID=2011014 RepID=UPI000BB79A2F|nr:HAMP domain-containing sensor histidine kinase [Bacillus sp. FJAT-45350]
MKKKTIFNEELEFLEQAKEVISDGKHNEEQLHPKYIELINRYEKLLKTSMKTTRISDIQGKRLKTQGNEINSINESLKAVEKSRKRYISEISHELGSPMMAIQSFINGMINGSIKPEKTYLKIIHEKIALVNRLIEELFDLAKLEEQEVNFRLVDIPLNGIYTLFDRYKVDCKTKNISLIINPISTNFTLTQVSISIEPFRIQQVLTNIIENALKHTPEGGKIEVHFNTNIKDYLMIEIEDNGLGIKPEAIPHVFTRFYKQQTPLYPEVSSTGLGLAIAREIIIKHGGQISVRSEPGKGSIFYFTIPIMRK